MKKLSNLLAALVFVSLVIFISCNSSGGDDDPVDPLQTQLDLISGTWTTSTNEVLRGGTPPDDSDWGSFTLTISNGNITTGGDYSTTNVPAGFEDVWPSQGSWTWQNTQGTIITRGASGNAQAVNLTVVAGTNTLQISFNNTGLVGRTSGIEGAWTFNMTK